MEGFRYLHAALSLFLWPPESQKRGKGLGNKSSYWCPLLERPFLWGADSFEYPNRSESWSWSSDSDVLLLLLKRAWKTKPKRLKPELETYQTERFSPSVTYSSQLFLAKLSWPSVSALSTEWEHNLQLGKELRDLLIQAFRQSRTPQQQPWREAIQALNSGHKEALDYFSMQSDYQRPQPRESLFQDGANICFSLTCIPGSWFCFLRIHRGSLLYLLYDNSADIWRQPADPSASSFNVPSRTWLRSPASQIARPWTCFRLSISFLKREALFWVQIIRLVCIQWVRTTLEGQTATWMVAWRVLSPSKS